MLRRLFASYKGPDDATCLLSRSCARIGPFPSPLPAIETATIQTKKGIKSNNAKEEENRHHLGFSLDGFGLLNKTPEEPMVQKTTADGSKDAANILKIMLLSQLQHGDAEMLASLSIPSGIIFVR